MYPHDETPLAALVGTADDRELDAILARRIPALAAHKQSSGVRFEPFRLPPVASTVLIVNEGEPLREVA